MKIQSIYDRYRIPVNLQLHMYRVAAVAWLISDDLLKDVNKLEIVSASLLHDMGNIIKFNLDLFPEQFENEGTEYWLQVQSEFINKYGEDEHEATIAIADEIGVEDSVMELVKAVGSAQSERIIHNNNYNKKIVNYCDYRVSPQGIVTLGERVEDSRKRTQLNKSERKWDEAKFNRTINAGIMLEKQIQQYFPYSLNMITDRKAKKIITELPEFEILNKK